MPWTRNQNFVPMELFLVAVFVTVLLGCAGRIAGRRDAGQADGDAGQADGIAGQADGLAVRR